jgi:hypothetical protein
MIARASLREGSVCGMVGYGLGRTAKTSDVRIQNSVFRKAVSEF